MVLFVYTECMPEPSQEILLGQQQLWTSDCPSIISNPDGVGIARRLLPKPANYCTLGHTNIASGTSVPPLVTLPADELKLASVPLRDTPLDLSLFPEDLGDDVGDHPASSLRLRLPPLGDDAVDIDDLALSGGDGGMPSTIVVVVGIRKAAEGSYFFRIWDGFLGAPLLALTDGDVVLLSPFSLTGIDRVFDGVCDLVGSDLPTRGVETTGDWGVLVSCGEYTFETPGDVPTPAQLLLVGDWGFPSVAMGEFDSPLSANPGNCTGS